MTPQEIEAKLVAQDGLLATLKADNETLKADNAVLKTEATVAKMTAKEKKAFGNMTAKQKDDYMAADAEKRKSMMKEFGKPEDDDEADDGDSDGSAKKIAKAEREFKAELAKRDERIVKAEAELTAITKRARLEHFTKRAEAELPNTPGKPVEKGETLMTLAESLGGEESDRFKAVMTTMKSADAALGVSFREKGSAGALTLPAGKQLDAHATEIAKRDKITVEKAYSVAMMEHPDLVEQYDREHRQFARNQ